MTVVVLGSLNQDLFIRTERHPQVGETVAGDLLHPQLGGKGLNAAIAAARAGSRTAFVGCVGDDDGGHAAREYLAVNGVDVSGLQVKPHVATGTAIVTVAAGQNTIVVSPGANGSIDESLVDAIELCTGDHVIAQLETPLDMTARLFPRARAAGATTIFNPSPAQNLPDLLLGSTDVMIVNEHELTLAFGASPQREQNLDDQAIRAVMRHRAFGGTVIVTLGERGAIAVTQTETVRVRSPKIVAADSTAAGDCFTGFIVASLHDGDELKPAMARACVAAALSVTRHGGSTSIPTADEVASFLPDRPPI
jgi:ribokinase